MLPRREAVTRWWTHQHGLRAGDDDMSVLAGRCLVILAGCAAVLMGWTVSTNAADPVDVCGGAWLSVDGTTTLVQKANDDPCPTLPPSDEDHPCPGWVVDAGPHATVSTAPLPHVSLHTQICAK